jgi:hypothetical protein
MTATPDVATLVRELRATLDHIGDALVNGRYDDLISTESRLASVVSGFAIASATGPLPRPVATELEDALASLRRCQRLGANFTDMSGTWLHAGHPHSNAYDRAGRAHAQASATTLETRA